MFLQQDKPTITVVITNHNYNDFINEALVSIAKQTLQPDKIIIVDDASDESCEELVKKFNYTYVKTNQQHPLLARKIGFEIANTDYICFLDADDKLPPEYLAKALSTLASDDTDIAYSNLQKFGDETTLVKFPEDIKPERLWQTNFLHVGCVVSRDAILISQAFEECPIRNDYHEDWLFWRNIVAAGFRYKKHDIPYLSRIHNRNRSKEIRNYAQARAIQDSTFQWFKYEEGNLLTTINKCRRTTADYIGISNLFRSRKYWVSMAQHLDHDIGAIQHKNDFLFVGPIIRNTIIRELEIPKWPIKVQSI